MYSKVIIGYDGSEQGNDALALGRSLGSAVGAELTLVGVADYDPLAPTIGYTASPPPEDAREQVKRAVMSEVEAPAASVGATPVAVLSTSPARGLEEVAEQYGADLIVVGSSHRGRVGRVLAGSVGERLLHGSPRAVAVAPLGLAQRDPAGIRVVGVGFDGNSEAELALRAATALAKAAGATLRVVAVVRPEPVVYGKGRGVVPSGGVEQATREFLEQKVDEALGAIKADVTADGSVLHGDPAEVLGEQDVDVMVVGSRRYGPVRTVLLGGVSLPLIRSSSCPVLVVPRGAPAGDEGASAERQETTA